MADNTSTNIVKKGGENPETVSEKTPTPTPDFSDTAYGHLTAPPSMGEKMFSPINKGSFGSFDYDQVTSETYMPAFQGKPSETSSFGGIGNELRDAGYHVPLDAIQGDFVENFKADMQSDWAALGNSVGRLVVGTASNLVSGTLGVLFELPELFTTGAADFNNIMYDFQKEVDEWSEDVMPVHRRADAYAFNPFDGEFWANTIANFGPTMALMVAGMYTGGAAAAGATRGGASLLSKAAGALRATGMSKKALALEQRAVQLISQGSKANRQVGAFAGSFTSRIMESGMEASHTFYDVFDEALANGASIDEANEKAAHSARMNFWTNMPLMAMDYLQFNSLFKAVSGKGSWKKAAGQFAFQATSEGLEEGFQYGMSESAKTADNVLGAFGGVLPAMGKAISENDRNFWDSVVQGAMGGGVFQALGSKTAKKYIDKAQAVFDTRKAEYLAKEEEIRNKILDLSEKDSFTESDYEFAKRVFGASNRSLIPEIKEKLQEVLNDETKLNQLVGEQVDIGNGIMVSGKKFIEDRIELIDKIEKKRKEVQDKYGIEGIGNDILNDETLIMLGEQKLNVVKEELERLKENNDPVSLSDNGKRILNVKRQIRNIEGTIDALKEMTATENGTSSDMDKQAVENQIKRLEDRKKEYSDIFEKLNKEIREGMTESELEELDMEMNYIEEVDPVLEPVEQYKSILESQIDIYRKTRNLLSNPEYSAKRRREKFIDNIRNADSMEVLSIFLNRNDRRLKDSETSPNVASINQGIEIDDNLQKIIDNKRSSLENLDQKKMKTRRKLAIKYQEFANKTKELSDKKKSLEDKDKSKLDEKEIKELELELAEIELEIENNKEKSEEYRQLVKDLDTQGAFAETLRTSGELTDEQQTEVNEAWDELEPIIEELNNQLESFNPGNFDTKINEFYDFIEGLNNMYEKYQKQKFALMTGMPDQYSQYDIDAMNYKLSKLQEIYIATNNLLKEISGFTNAELNSLSKASENHKELLENEDLTPEERRDIERKVHMFEQVQKGFEKTSANDVYYNPYSGVIRWKGKNYFPAMGNVQDSAVFDESGENLLGLVVLDENFNVINLVTADTSNKFEDRVNYRIIDELVIVNTEEDVQTIETNLGTINEIYDLYLMHNIIETSENNEDFLKQNFIYSPQHITQQLDAMSVITEQDSTRLTQTLIHVRRDKEFRDLNRLRKAVEEGTFNINGNIEELNKLLSPIKMKLAELGITSRTSREDIIKILEDPKNSQKIARILRKGGYEKVLELVQEIKKLKALVNRGKKVAIQEFNKRYKNLTDEELNSINQETSRRPSISFIEKVRSVQEELYGKDSTRTGQGENNDPSGNDPSDGGNTETEDPVTGLLPNEDPVDDRMTKILKNFAEIIDEEGNVLEGVTLQPHEEKFLQENKEFIIDIKEGASNEDIELLEEEEEVLEEEEETEQEEQEEQKEEEQEEEQEEEPEPVFTNDSPTKSVDKGNRGTSDELNLNVPVRDVEEELKISIEEYALNPIAALALNEIFAIAYRDYRSSWDFASNISESIRENIDPKKNKEDLKILDNIIQRSNDDTNAIADLLNNGSTTIAELADKKVNISVDFELLDLILKYDEYFNNTPEKKKIVKQLQEFKNGNLSIKDLINNSNISNKSQYLQILLDTIPFQISFEHEGETYNAYLHTPSYYSDSRIVDGDPAPKYHRKYAYNPKTLERVGVLPETMSLDGKEYTVEGKKYVDSRFQEYVTDVTNTLLTFRGDLANLLLDRNANYEVTSEIDTQSEGHLTYVNRTTDAAEFQSIPFSQALAQTARRPGLKSLDDIPIGISLGGGKFAGLRDERQTPGLIVPKGLAALPIKSSNGLYISVPVDQRKIDAVESEMIFDAAFAVATGIKKPDFIDMTDKKYSTSGLSASNLLDLLVYREYLKEGETPSKKDRGVAYFAIQKNQDGSGTIYYGSEYQIDIPANSSIDDIKPVKKKHFVSFIRNHFNRRLHAKGLSNKISEAGFAINNFKFRGQEYSLDQSYNEFVMNDDIEGGAVIKSFLTKLETNQSNLTIKSDFKINQKGPTSFGQSNETPPNNPTDSGGVLDNLEDLEDDSSFMQSEESESIEVIQQEELDKQKRFIRKNLPQIPFEIIDRMIPIANDKFAFGVFIMSVGYLNGQEGFKAVASRMQSSQRRNPLYHEVMHGVFRMLLTEEEQQIVLKELKEEFGEPTQEQIDALEGVNNAEEWYEEKLAEKYRIFKTQQGQEESVKEVKPKNFIEKFFNWISSLFNAFKKNPSFIQKMFDDIDQGRYASRVPFTDRIKKNSTSFMQSDLQPFNPTTYNLYKELFFADLFSKIDFVNFDGTNLDILKAAGNNEDQRKKYYTSFLDKIITGVDKRIEKLERLNTKASERKIKIFEAKKNKISKFSEFINNNFEQFEKDLSEHLIDKFDLTQDEKYDEDNVPEEEITGQVVRRASYQIHYKQKAADVVKLLIGVNTKRKLNVRTMGPEIVPENGLYNFLIEKFADVRPLTGHSKPHIDLYIDILEKEVVYRPELKLLLTRLQNLKNSPNGKHIIKKFIVAFNNSDKNFATANIEKENKDEITVRIDQSSTDNNLQELLMNYHSNFQNSGNVIVDNKTGEVDINDKVLEENIKAYEEFIEDLSSRLGRRPSVEDYESALKGFSIVLFSFGIDISPVSIKYTIDKRLNVLGDVSSPAHMIKLKIQNLLSLATSLDWMISDNSSKNKSSFKWLLEENKKLRSVPKDQRKNKEYLERLDKIYNFGEINTPMINEFGNFKDLAKNDLSFRYDIIDHSMVGGQSSKYYKYSNPTYLDNTIHELNNNDRRFPLLKDNVVGTENSLILKTIRQSLDNEGKADSELTPRPVFKIHTLNTIIKRGSSDIGEKAAKIDESDELSFFLNAALNARRGETSLYRLPSFADKGTAHKMISGIGKFHKTSSSETYIPYSLFNQLSIITPESKISLSDDAKKIITGYLADELNTIKALASNSKSFPYMEENMYFSKVFPELPLYKLLEKPEHYNEYIHNSLLSKSETKLNKKGQKILKKLKEEHQKRLSSMEKEYKSTMKYHQSKTDPGFNLKNKDNYFTATLQLGEDLFSEIFEDTRHKSTSNSGNFTIESLTKVIKMKAITEGLTKKYMGMTAIAMLKFEDVGLISFSKDTEQYKLNAIDNEIRKNYLKRYNTEERPLTETELTKIIIGDYIFNSQSAIIETTKILTGDPSWYKNIVDYVKRTPAIITDGIYGEKNGGSYGVSTIDDSILKQQASKFLSNKADNRVNVENGLKDSLKLYFDGFETLSDSIADKQIKSLVKKIQDGYSSMDITDAQAYVTFERFLQMMEDVGRKPLPADVVSRIKRGTETLEDHKKLLEEIQWFSTQPLKGVFFDLREIELDNGDVIMMPSYHKYSQAVLYPSLVRGNPFLEKLYGSMTANNEGKSDEVIFKSGHKVGFTELSSFENDEFILNPQQHLKGSWKLQQDLPPNKYLKTGRTTGGSQKEKNIISNIQLNRKFKPSSGVSINGEVKDEITGKELITEIYKTNSAISNLMTNRMLDEIEFDGVSYNKGKLFEKVKRDLSTRGVPSSYQNVMHSMEYLDELIPYRNDLVYSFSSMVNKHAINISEPGGAFIQMSGFGIQQSVQAYSKLTEDQKGRIIVIDDLRPTTVENNNGNIDVKVGSIFLPHRIQEMIEKVSKKDIRELSLNQIKGYLEDSDVLNGIAYRIPNQGITSIEYVNIAGFLPQEMGDTVIVNDETTSKYGSDFDIDKLYVFMPNLYINNGKIERIPFLDTDDLETHFRFRKRRIENRVERLNEKLANKRYTGKLTQEEEDSINQEILELNEKFSQDFVEFKKENKNKTVFELNSRAQLENRKFSLYETILKDPFTATMSLIPLDQTAQWLKNDIKDLHGESEYRQSSMFFTDIGQIEAKTQNISASYMIALGANNEVNQVLNQIHNVYLDLPGVQRKDIDGILDEDGNFILHNIDAFLNAFVDAAKDPFIINGNINDYTFNEAVILLKLGFNRKKVLAFIGQPALKDLASIHFRSTGRFRNTIEGYNPDDEFDTFFKYRGKNNSKKLKRKFNEKISQKTIGKLLDEVMSLSNGKADKSGDSIKNSKLGKAIQGKSENPRDFNNLFGLSEDEMISILALFKKLKEVKQVDVTEMLASKIDVNGMKGGMDAVIAQEEQMRESLNLSLDEYNNVFIPLLRGNFSTDVQINEAIELLEERSNASILKNFYKKFYDPSMGGVTALGTYYVNSIIVPQDIFADEFVSFSQKTKEIVRLINEQLGNPYAKNQKLNKVIIDNLYAYLFSDMPMFEDVDFNKLKRLFFNQEDSRSLALTFKTLLSARISTRVRNGKKEFVRNKAALENYEIGKYLKSFANSSTTRPQFLYSNNFSSKSKPTKEVLISEFSTFLSGLDASEGLGVSTRATLKRAFKDLVLYSYYTSGFMYTSKSFFDLLPPYVYEEVKDHIGTKINDFMNDATISEDLIEQIKQNNWHNPSFTTQLNKKDSGISISSVKIGESTYNYAEITNPIKVLKGKDALDNFVYSEMINIVSYSRGQKVNQTMRLIGVRRDEFNNEIPLYAEARKKGYNNKGNRIVEYRKGKDIYDSIIPENNRGIDYYTYDLTEDIKEALDLNDYSAGKPVSNVNLKEITEITDKFNQESESTESQLGNVKITSTNYTRNTPKENPNTAYVFTENINSIEGGITGQGSAVIRNNPNAIGIVTKKYYFYRDLGNRKGDRTRPEAIAVKKAYKGKGNWYDQNFQDTDADFELFKKINLEQFAKLDKYNNIIFPQGFASDKAKLPTRFAEWLQNELLNRYGLVTELNNKGTGLISKSVQQSSKPTVNETENNNKEITEEVIEELEKIVRDNIKLFRTNKDLPNPSAAMQWLMPVDENNNVKLAMTPDELREFLNKCK